MFTHSFPEWEAIARTWVGHNERLSRNKMVGYRPSLRSLYVLPLCGLQLAGHTVNRFVQLGNLLGQVLPAGDEPSSQSVSQSVSGSVGQRVLRGDVIAAASGRRSSKRQPEVIDRADPWRITTIRTS